MSQRVSILQYWGGCPETPNSKWQRFLHLLRQCAAKGWRTCLVWSRMPQDPSLSRPFLDLGCEIIVHPRVQRNFDLGCIRRTYEMLRHVECDVFHCHNVHTSPLIAAALARVPVRIWSKLAMSPYYEQNESPRGLHRLQISSRLSVALAHRVLCISQAVSEELLHGGNRREKLVVMPAPVDLDMYGRDCGNGMRAELGLSDSDVLISSVGHAVPVKGWDVLIHAFARVIRAVPRARLLLVGSIHAAGETEFAGCLRQLIRRLSLDEQVRFLGRRNDIPRILAATNVFAFPSRSEGQGLALVEALACGLPCVASRTGGIQDLIQDGFNGLLVSREDPVALAESLIDVIRNQDLRDRLRTNARSSVGGLGLQAATTSLLRLYEYLLEQNTHRVGTSVGPNSER